MGSLKAYVLLITSIGKETDVLNELKSLRELRTELLYMGNMTLWWRLRERIWTTLTEQ